MTTVNCPKCKKEVEINIANAVDENGEEHQCPHCGLVFRYTDR